MPGGGIIGVVTGPTLAAIEFTVADLEPCLQLLVGLAGLELVAQGRHPVFDADVAQVRAGPVTINLLSPTDTGAGSPWPYPDTHLSQLTFTVPDVDEVARVRSRLAEGGAPVIERDESMFLVDADVVNGLFGTDAALAFCLEDETTEVTSGMHVLPEGGLEQ